MTAGCPKCGGPVAPGDAFCGTCGTPVAAQPSRPAGPAPSAQPAAAPAAPQPTAPPPPPARKGGAGKAFAIGCAILALLLLCAGAAVGAFALLTRSGYRITLPEIPSLTGSGVTPVSPDDASPPPGGSPAPSDGSATPKGGSPAPKTGPRTYPTPLGALKAKLPKGWVYRLAHDKPQQKEYWVGPPASEWTDVYLVEPTSDGRWVMKESYPFEVVP